ncbi:hypothetical protein JYU34_009583 [Plutella xylostella]|uniref:Cuticular protein n=1 Tax=Plutella xylostella TaxID=51655 RepID=A0ABQ7QMX3_PLUXY|nr:hypothetical protein JYU34_009583 [Plutella xylostella]
MIPRFKKCFSVFATVILLASLINASSVVKDALEEHLKDVAHDEAANTLRHDKQKGEKVHEIDTEITDNHKNQYSKADDEAKYLKKDHDTNSHHESDAYQGHNAQQDKVEESKAGGYKRGHKKGHHKQGFQNSYHKDESSNKSTFFDDFNDEGDQAAYNSRLNSHDNQGGRSYQGAHNKGQEYVRDNHHGGGYARRGELGDSRAGHRDHARRYHLDDRANHNQYHDDRNQYDRRKEHDRYDYQKPIVHHDRGWDQWDDRRDWDRPVYRGWQSDPGWQRDPGWDRNYGGPGYYDDHGLRHDGGYGYGPNHGFGYGYDESRADPVAEVPVPNSPVIAQRKQTITIYEDPRYDGKDKGQLRREEGDHLQLDFQPSSQRYASYDDTYYAPLRDGRVESSKINRLVYNYKRQ